MRTMRRLLAVPLLVVAFVAGGALWAWADHAETLPTNTCASSLSGANITNAVATPIPAQVDPITGAQTAPPKATLRLDLADKSCIGVIYNAVVLDTRPSNGTAAIVGTASLPGDGESTALTFTFTLPDSSSVCIYAATLGGGGGSSTGKTGAAFDGQNPGGMIDRAPDGAGGEGYCVTVGGGSGGQSFH